MITNDDKARIFASNSEEIFNLKPMPNVPGQLHKQTNREHVLGVQVALKALRRILWLYENEEQNPYPSPYDNELAQIIFSRQSGDLNQKTYISATH